MQRKKGKGIENGKNAQDGRNVSQKRHEMISEKFAEKIKKSA